MADKVLKRAERLLSLHAKRAQEKDIGQPEDQKDLLRASIVLAAAAVDTFCHVKLYSIARMVVEEVAKLPFTSCSATAFGQGPSGVSIRDVVLSVLKVVCEAKPKPSRNEREESLLALLAADRVTTLLDQYETEYLNVKAFMQPGPIVAEFKLMLGATDIFEVGYQALDSSLSSGDAQQKAKKLKSELHELAERRNRICHLGDYRTPADMVKVSITRDTAWKFVGTAQEAVRVLQAGCFAKAAIIQDAFKKISEE